MNVCDGAAGGATGGAAADGSDGESPAASGCVTALVVGNDGAATVVGAAVTTGAGAGVVFDAGTASASLASAVSGSVSPYGGNGDGRSGSIVIGLSCGG